MVLVAQYKQYFHVSAPLCQAAVNQMAHGKTPGVDGLPAEFYKCFWPLFGEDLVAVLNCCYSSGRLSPSQQFQVDHPSLQVR